MSDTARLSLRLAEHQFTRALVVPPTEQDLRLAKRLRERSMLDVRWPIGGDVEVTSGPWVGVAHFDAFDVAVEPKLVGGELRVMRMLEYSSGIDLLRLLDVDRPLPADGGDLFELVCLLLAQEVQALIVDGILRDYHAVDEELGVLRGRLRHRDQYLRRFGRLDVLECTFDEFDANTPDNQLLTVALARAARRAAAPKTCWALSGLHGLLGQVCQPPTADADHYRTHITYNRRNQRYRRAHELALIILDGLAFDDLYDTSSGRATAFLLNMNRLFESFITRLVQHALVGTDLTATTQKRLHAVVRDEQSGATYAVLRPDLVVDGPAGPVPIDVKYKAYDTKKISTDDIYQTFLYAYALGGSDRERRAGILFPSSARSTHRLAVSPLGERTDARIVGIGIDVPTVLDQLMGAEMETALHAVRRTVEDICGYDQPAPMMAATSSQDS
jgi:5-methylcytosine-specific restriction enzyme subunit McrC